MDERELSRQRVSVIGAARSGVAVARLLKAKGARVLVSDVALERSLTTHLEELKHAGISYETGGHTERAYDCSLMVVSPGVPSNAPVVVEAHRRGIEIVSELEIASWYCRAPIVAVTGSNGKTTTTTLIGRILGDAKKKHVVAGNIGTAFSSVVLDLDEAAFAVLEVSSFQLDFCKTFRPNVSVILNVTPDHMDRYDNSMEKYSMSKSRIFMNQTVDDIHIYNADDEWTRRLSSSVKCQALSFGMRHEHGNGAFVENDRLTTVIRGNRTDVIGTKEISIPGGHNLYNAMAATLVGQVLGVGPASVRATLRNFKGVEHRLEFVREVRGVGYVNDSKATNVDSVRYAIQAYDRPIVLLLGGRDKGNDYSKLEELVEKRVRAIVAIGESAEKVEKAFQGRTVVETAPPLEPSIPKRLSMERAVHVAAGLARPGDIVLLSPACASFDWFTDYEERGRIFKEIVNSIL
jgi:UDP-N-acetylmuramoylalanine--D-glutamate ligase